MSRTSKKLSDPLVALSTLVLFVLITLTMSQVILRTIFNYPLIGAEELARYFLICIVFLGTPIAAKERIHISMLEIQSKLPPKFRIVLEGIIEVTWLVVFGFLTVSVSTALVHNINNRTVNLGIPSYVFLAPTLIGFFMTAVVSARHLLSLRQRGRESNTDIN